MSPHSFFLFTKQKVESSSHSTTSSECFWLELFRVDVQDWHVSPTLLHYGTSRRLQSHLQTKEADTTKPDWVSPQLISSPLTRKIIMILPCPFTRADLSVRRRATAAKCGKDCVLMKEGCTCCSDKVLFFLFSPTDCESPHLQNKLKWTTFIYFFSQGQKNNRFRNPADFLWVCIYVRVPCCLQFTLAFAHPLLNIYVHVSAKPELRGKLNLRNWFYLKVGDLWAILCCVNLPFQQFI